VIYLKKNEVDHLVDMFFKVLIASWKAISDEKLGDPNKN
jgi:hypothetical protein